MESNYFKVALISRRLQNEISRTKQSETRQSRKETDKK